MAAPSTTCDHRRMGQPDGGDDGPTSGAVEVQTTDDADGTSPAATPTPPLEVPVTFNHASELPLWSWPALATIAVAATGQLAGAWYAAIMIVVIVTASMAALIGARAGRHRWSAAVVAAVVAVLAVGALLFSSDALQTLTTSQSDSSAEPTPTGTTAELLGPGANLRGLDLSKQSLQRINLRGADLSGANLSGSDLSSAALDGAILRGADLHDACLRNARLTGADISGADFTGADVRGAVIDGSTDAVPASWLPVPSSLATCHP